MDLVLTHIGQLGLVRVGVQAHEPILTRDGHTTHAVRPVGKSGDLGELIERVKISDGVYPGVANPDGRVLWDHVNSRPHMLERLTKTLAAIVDPRFPESTPNADYHAYADGIRQTSADRFIAYGSRDHAAMLPMLIVGGYTDERWDPNRRRFEAAHAASSATTITLAVSASESTGVDGGARKCNT